MKKRTGTLKQKIVFWSKNGILKQKWYFEAKDGILEAKDGILKQKMVFWKQVLAIKSTLLSFARPWRPQRERILVVRQSFGFQNIPLKKMSTFIAIFGAPLQSSDKKKYA